MKSTRIPSNDRSTVNASGLIEPMAVGLGPKFQKKRNAKMKALE